MEPMRLSPSCHFERLFTERSDSRQYRQAAARGVHSEPPGTMISNS